MRFSSLHRDNEVVLNLVIINVIFFGVKFVLNTMPQYAGMMDMYLSLHYAGSEGFYPWQIITSMFMHVDFMHILFNMVALYSIGTVLERIWGPKRFLFFYISCGLGGAFVYEIWQAVQVYQAIGSLHIPSGREFDYTGVAEGASGAIYGVLAALALIFPNTELFLMFIPIPLKAKYVVPGLILMDLFFGISNRSMFGMKMANFAHIGGALFGALIVLYWKRKRDTFF